MKFIENARIVEVSLESSGTPEDGVHPITIVGIGRSADMEDKESKRITGHVPSDQAFRGDDGRLVFMPGSVQPADDIPLVIYPNEKTRMVIGRASVDVDGNVTAVMFGKPEWAAAHNETGREFSISVRKITNETMEVWEAVSVAGPPVLSVEVAKMQYEAGR